MTDHSRRVIIAGLGVGAAAVPLLGDSTRGQVNVDVDRSAGQRISPDDLRQLAARGASQIEATEHWAQKDSTKLYLYRKRFAPLPGEKQPVLFLVHGSSNSSRSSYDLTVPGKGEYSMMNVFARFGFDVWTMDHDGYGRSGSSGNNSDIASGVEDLKAAIPVVLRESGQPKLHMYGTSSGAIRAGAYAQTEPQRIDRLVLSAFTYRGTGSPEIARRNANADKLRASPRRKRDLAMIRSIFTRDGHSGYEPGIGDAIAEDELKFGDTIPSGTYLDMAVNLPLVDPKKVLAPVLMIRGAADGNSTNEDLLDFYTQLPNQDRAFAILPAAHSLGYSNNRHLLWYAVRNFLQAPAAAGA